MSSSYFARHSVAQPLWGPLTTEEGVRFRLWAPAKETVLLRLDGEDRPMRAAGDGWLALDAPDARPGAEYAFVMEDGLVVPDPASRAQAGSVHGPSRVPDRSDDAWQIDNWQGRPWEEAVICEIHIGTFTREGTFRAAIEKLPHLAETGYTAIEIMPVAQFAGDRGWGYDGVLLYAPHRAYGSPDDLKALVDAAHGQGLMVLLDVVYNHFGPDGNYLHAYAPEFFDEDRETPWGAAIDYARPPVRRFFIDNALYWIGEFRLDGLRLDAVDNVRDPQSDPEILVEIARTIREAFPDRRVHLTTEDNRNITRLHERAEDGGVPLYTGEWNDDFHNIAHVIASGESEGYYADFAEDCWAKLARALAEGFIYQGEPSPRSGAPQGEPSAHLPPTAFVDFLQNHDQAGNRAFGERLLPLTEPALLRALSAILLLSPHIPLMFMGEEWGETKPFLFFTDFDGELAEIVREGRRREFKHFAAFEDPERRARIPDPNARETFEASKIDWGAPERPEGAQWHAFTQRLLEIRQRVIVPHLAGARGNSGRVIAAEEGIVAVSWTLDGLALHMRANLTEVTRPGPRLPGSLLHSENGAGASGDLPGFSAAFTTQTAQLP
jgi:maltooligosyltrehalose trehalohydrolase